MDQTTSNLIRLSNLDPESFKMTAYTVEIKGIKFYHGHLRMDDAIYSALIFFEARAEIDNMIKQGQLKVSIVNE